MTVFTLKEVGHPSAQVRRVCELHALSHNYSLLIITRTYPIAAILTRDGSWAALP